MNVGKMTEARDQVLTTFFSLRLFIASTRPWRRSSMNGPFLIERDMLYLLPLLAMTRSDDESSGRLGPPGSTGLADVLVLVVKVADLADRGHAAERDATHLVGRHPDRGVVAFRGEKL